MLGSSQYAGNIIGSLVASYLFERIGSKQTLVLFYLGNIASLLMFVASNNFMILVSSRIAIGFFKVLLMIFIPVWGDAFGDEKQKSKWMTLYMITAPFGVVIGYSLTAIFMKFSTWYYAFYFEIVMFAPFFLYHLSTPEKYSNL